MTFRDFLLTLALGLVAAFDSDGVSRRRATTSASSAEAVTV